MISELGYVGSQSHLRATVLSYRNSGKAVVNGDLREKYRLHWLEWMYLLERGQLPAAKITDEPTRKELVARLKNARGFERRKALVILAHQQLFSNKTISACLGISAHSTREYIRKFTLGGVASLFEKRRGHQKQDDEALKAAVFSALHEPPSLSNINRTTWKMDDLRRVLADRGFVTCKDVIRQIIHKAGYKWRIAKTVLTSNDPDYREKIGKVKCILSNLGEKDRFFSIDEYGPFAIKLTGGRVLSAPNERPTVPQWQRSKGSLIMTAALDLVENQVVHFLSDAKNTEEMIKMAEVLVEKYHDCRRLYLSWDAASWHISKALKKFIGEYNAIAGYADLPQLESIPLPAGAQFLNVIESVFSGMARAIIHNSNYASKAEAAAAINRYFMDRNQHFQEHPNRAGDKIWRMERTPANFDPSNNCKDPAYR
jgi:transposase